VFWVTSVHFNIRNTLLKSGTFLLGHPVYMFVLKKSEEQRLEAAQIKFLRHLLGITKLDKEKSQCIREKRGAQNIVKEIKQYQEK